MWTGFLLIAGAIIMFAAGILANPGYAEINPKNIIGMWLFDEAEGENRSSVLASFQRLLVIFHTINKALHLLWESIVPRLLIDSE